VSRDRRPERGFFRRSPTTSSATHDWFLTAAERGNESSIIDRGASADGWSGGNRVHVLVHGAEYFSRLCDVLCSLDAFDSVHFTDWEGDPDERPLGSDVDFAALFTSLVRSGVRVRGLIWRSHPRQLAMSEQPNIAFARDVNQVGGEVLLDERVRRGGSHHQKLVVVGRPRSPAGDVAFVGGIDLGHGRRDDARHLGDPQPVALSKWYGPHPPWHDVQLEVQGPAVAALADTFRERWTDPTPLDHRNPVRRLLRTRIHQPSRGDPLPPSDRDPPPAGPHAVQVLRTYPAKRPRYPFAPEGERSIARAYLKALARARRLVYIEDQFFWSMAVSATLSAQMEQFPTLRVLIVVPRFPDRDGIVSSRSARIGRQDALRALRRVGADRVLVCDVENLQGNPVYVHSKVCIIDDVWMLVGSSNVNRRSWTHDSELSCAVLDENRDPRAPRDPAGLGDDARVLARETRLRLWCEHLGRTPDDHADLVDPDAGFETFRAVAETLDAWTAGGGRGPRPPGRVRQHRPPIIPEYQARWARLLARWVDDPDGRPRRLRRLDHY
jgi:phosphatidylserine/phosphatidylglycerophosphate/cardiolipin synthase-like enzyme